MQADLLQTDLSIIIVTWNVWDLLRACLQSIEQVSRDVGVPNDIRTFGPLTVGKQAPTLEVIVVDNASTDATVELLTARFPWVRLIRSATNLGFTAGNNVGYAASRGRTLYFLNPDTELPNGELVNGHHQATAAGNDSLWTLYRALMEEPKIGLVGPQLRYGDNTYQASCSHFPTPLTAFFASGTLGRYWRNNPWLRHLEMKDWPSTFRQEVDWVNGAAMLARRSALEEVRISDSAGPFDEGFFMYSEEVDLCKRLKQAHWRIAYIPEATVIHYQGRSSRQVVVKRDILFYSSLIRYYEKYIGLRWAALLRFFLLWVFRSEIVIEAGKWLLGHQRPLRAQRIAAYRQVLASKLHPQGETPSTRSGQ